MEVWMFVFTAISALTGIIASLPVLGADIRIWGREMFGKDAPSVTRTAIFKSRSWALLAISSLALVFSVVGVIGHFVVSGRPNVKE